jgi:hypothetical protein
MNFERRTKMEWVEIITLRSPTKINNQFVDELVRQVDRSDTPEHLVEIRTYHHSVVETDLSIHLHWKSEPGSQHHKSPLGLKFSYALRNLGLLNHSVWVETAAEEAPIISGNSSSQDITARDTKGNALETRSKIVDKEGL